MRNITLLVGSVVVGVLASIGVSADDGIKEGKDYGYASLSSVGQTVEENTARKTTNVIFNHRNTYFYDKDLSEAQREGNSQLSHCERVVNKEIQSTLTEFVECEAVVLAGKNMNSRPTYSIDREQDPLIVDSKDTISDAYENSSTTGTFCNVVKETKPAVYREKSCMATLAPLKESEESCTVTQEKVCSGGEGEYEYADGGIDIDQRMEAVSNFTGESSEAWRLLVSTITMRSNDLLIELNPSYRDRRAGVYEASYTFSIKNYEDLPRAVFTHGHVDDGLTVYINGVQVYKFGVYKFGWRRWGIRPNLDVLNNLREGENEIRVVLYNNSRRTGTSLAFDIPVASDCKTKTTTTCSARQQNPNICSVENEVCTEYDELGNCVTHRKDLMCGDERKWINECPSSELQGCGQISSECTNFDKDGNCVTYNQKYSCEVSSEEVVETTQCEQKLCDGDNCIGMTAEKDTSFGSAVSMMEVQRQAGVDGREADGSYNIFKGEGGSCTVKVLAGHSLMSCCKTIDTGDKFQNRTQGATHSDNYGNEPNQAITTSSGSQYVYDQVFDTNETVAQAQSVITGGWLQCEKEEAVLGIKRGNNLCFQTDEKCTKETFFGSCLEKTRYYCCFKSTLARIINTEGRKQLGKGVGCGGFTLDELEKIDFSVIDFTEFVDEIVPKDIDVDQRKADITQTANDNFDDRVSYYEQ